MKEYTICNQADEDVFNKQCSALEKRIPGIIVQELLIDVDNSKIQHYKIGNSAVVVHNDYEIGAVYVKSEVELEPYFN